MSLMDALVDTADQVRRTWESARSVIARWARPIMPLADG
jgi:hypothetical protein